MGANDMFREAFRSVTDFIFPPECLICRSGIPGEDILCPECRGAVERAAERYRPPPRSIDGVDDICVLLPYDDTARTLVHALKYHGMPSVGVWLGGLAGAKAAERIPESAHALIVPVPLHPAKLLSRGYNQSERLAHGAAGSTGYSVREDLIARTRETPTQTALDEFARRKNVAGAFEFTGRQRLAGETVIIIDDVLTTGSTVSECATALKQGGAGTVIAAVAATPGTGED